MTEESDAWIKWLKKDIQESWAQMAEMMELIRILIRDKGQASSPSPQNKTAQQDQRKEEPVYPVGFTAPYAQNVHMAQASPTQQAGGFPYSYAPSPTQTHKVGQNSGVNMADPITIPDLDDLKEWEDKEEIVRTI